MRQGALLAGRYRLESVLGAGGMGEVWRASDTELKREVAVKFLLHGNADGGLDARFQREAVVGAALQHPGITVVHDTGRHEGRPFLVMELLQGHPLSAVLASAPGPLAVDVAVGLALQASEALGVAHTHGVVHRDLKPGNLFVQPDGRLKVCDFGIAHLLDATRALTGTGLALGTPSYMAPEQWLGEAIDGRCDLYALGCVLYEMLTGRPPFTGKSPYALMRQHVEETPSPLPGGTGIPLGLAQLVLALLEKNPESRPATADDVARQLRRIAAGRGPNAVAPGDPHATSTGRSQAPVDDALRNLLLEAATELRELPQAFEARCTVARAAAKTDAELALGLLEEAEVGTQLGYPPDSLVGLARLVKMAAEIADFAPRRAARIAGEAAPLVFEYWTDIHDFARRDLFRALGRTVPRLAVELAIRHRRAGYLEYVMGEIAECDQALAESVIGGFSERSGKRDYLAVATFRHFLKNFPVRAEAFALRHQLRDGWERDRELALAWARFDAGNAQRIAAAISSHWSRIDTLCEIAAISAAHDPEKARAIVEEAVKVASWAAQDIAGELQEKAALKVEVSQPVAAARLMNEAARVLRMDPVGGTGKEDLDKRLRSIAETRLRIDSASSGVGMVGRKTLTIAEARRRAEEIRQSDDRVERATALARLVEECLPAERTWLPQVLQDRGGSASRGDTAPVQSEPGEAQAARGYWHTHRMSKGVAYWGTEDEHRNPTIGATRIDDGTTIWSVVLKASRRSSRRRAYRRIGDLSLSERWVHCTVKLPGDHGSGNELTLFAIDRESGRVVWRRSLPQVAETAFPKIVLDEGVLLLVFEPEGALGADFFAFDTQTGIRLWRHTVRNESVKVSLTARRVLLDILGDYVCLDRAMGATVWKSKGLARANAVGSDGIGSPLFVQDSLAAVGTVSAEDGAKGWSHDFLPCKDFSSWEFSDYHDLVDRCTPRCAVWNDTIVVLSRIDHHTQYEVVTVLHLATGATVWECAIAKAPTASWSWNIRQLALQDELVHVVYAAQSGSAGTFQVLSLDLGTGHRVWERTLVAERTDSPPFTFEPGLVMFRTPDDQEPDRNRPASLTLPVCAPPSAEDSRLGADRWIPGTAPRMLEAASQSRQLLWRAEAGVVGGLVVSGHGLYFQYADETGSGDGVVDVQTGTRQWRRPGNEGTSTDAIALDGRIYRPHEGGGLYVIKPRNGSRKLLREQYPGGIVVQGDVDNRAFIASKGRVSAMADGRELWSTQTHDAPSDGSLLAVGEDLLCLNSSPLGAGHPATCLSALAVSDGQPVWHFDCGDLPTDVSFGAGHVFAHTGTALIALEAATGTLRWRVELPFLPLAGPKPGSLAVASDVVLTVRSGALLAYDAATGVQLWVSRCSPASGLRAVGAEVLFHDTDALHSIAVRTGKANWSYAMTSGGVRPLFDVDRIYAVSDDGAVSCLQVPDAPARPPRERWRRLFG
ncbi:PQQ-binding-like beta-propeller repeat protein [Kitasatospora sp. NPDC051984]|uniref:protein kinase domain-containing protein n=1 Tax=Kitasatospora sp. NPDC051984 TaxID=3364059 RepID=UPI0037C5131B